MRPFAYFLLHLIQRISSVLWSSFCTRKSSGVLNTSALAKSEATPFHQRQSRPVTTHHHIHHSCWRLTLLPPVCLSLALHQSRMQIYTRIFSFFFLSAGNDGVQSAGNCVDEQSIALERRKENIDWKQLRCCPFNC